MSILAIILEGGTTQAHKANGVGYGQQGGW